MRSHHGSSFSHDQAAYRPLSAQELALQPIRRCQVKMVCRYTNCSTVSTGLNVAGRKCDSGVGIVFPLSSTSSLYQC